MSSRAAHRRPGAWYGYLAAAWAFAFAVPSLLWGSGISAGARTVGRDLPSYTWSNHAGVLAAVLFTGCLKVVGGLFALALVRPGSRVLPWRRVTLIGGYALAGFLILYGLQDIVPSALMELHVIGAPRDPDWFAMRWHVLLWGPYFAVWGILLGSAVRHYQGSYRDGAAGSVPPAQPNQRAVLDRDGERAEPGR